MKRLLCLFLFSLICAASFAQGNLVPNPSFEFDIACPNNNAQINFAVPWVNPSAVSPDLYDSCCTNYGYDVPDNSEGEQDAHSNGSAYAGIITRANGDYQEYIQVKLSDSLRTNHFYCVNYFVSLAGRSKYATLSPQLFFSDTAISSTSQTYFPYQPQINPNFVVNDTTDWVLISGYYVANGGENYITIGNFYPDLLTPFDSMPNGIYPTAYYYIDDVSVAECDTIAPPIYSAFTLTPNPSNGQFQLAGDFPIRSQLHVFNLLGQEVESPIDLPEGNNTTHLYFTLAEGAYIYRIMQDKDLIYTSKFEVTK
ncbi:MAG TPA: T9SS type A sorting domain-containing protein [Bacteroidia bacterium]|jgi:hypothetical protein|nr:T9SS type A sorting domain-containing protein [Bacteroidia bacterium]